MYHHVEGVLALLVPARAVVEAGGIGFDLRIPLSTFEALKGRAGQKVRLLAHLWVQEDDHRLYGFATEKERDLFRLATSVSGVGPATALSLLAAFDAAAFAGLIRSGDAGSLRRIKGVGPKLSERMVFELKDRVGELLALAGPEGTAIPRSVTEDAVAALVTMGFGRREADRKVEMAVRKLLAGPPAEDPLKPGPLKPGPLKPGKEPPTVEEVIRAAIQIRDR